MQNIAAHTRPFGAVPPYVSINRIVGVGVRITVRDHQAHASIDLPEEDWNELAGQILEDQENGNR